MNPPVDVKQLRKRMLIFYFAAGVNLLMGFWVMSAGSSQAGGGGTVTLIMLVFLGFAALNYYMARKIGKYLRSLQSAPPAQGSSNP